jgi:ABC-type Na+ efflux pump permease subunit
MKKAEKVIGILLFAVTALLVVYAVWAFINCESYISDAVAAGQLVISESLYDVMNFYMTNCAQYFIFALFLFGMGWFFIRGAFQQTKRAKVTEPMDSSDAESDSELDEWFEEMGQEKQGHDK